ncbi:MAG: hypothetical protein ACE5GS_05605 [Kiloniellaceae bacterium]
MKIGRRSGGAKKESLRAELQEILRSGRSDGPVCGPGCARPDSRACSRACPDIPRALSSDPDNHPLETRIAPLVFELKRLGVFEPCWSCAGHNGADGALWKVPRVWFYCRSVVHVRVLAESIQELHLHKKLNAPWHIVITFSEHDNADTTFSLEPRLEGRRPNLTALQTDIEAIAEHLRDLVFREVEKLSAAIK